MTLSDDGKWETFQNRVNYNHSAAELLVFSSGGAASAIAPYHLRGLWKKWGRLLIEMLAWLTSLMPLMIDNCVSSWEVWPMSAGKFFRGIFLRTWKCNVCTYLGSITWRFFFVNYPSSNWSPQTEKKKSSQEFIFTLFWLCLLWTICSSVTQFCVCFMYPDIPEKTVWILVKLAQILRCRCLNQIF